MGELGVSYAADFTSATNGTCDICGVQAILKYMRHKNPEKLGRHLCPTCYHRYLNKEGTVRRSHTGTQQGVATEHRQAIHQQIAKAQRGCTY